MAKSVAVLDYGAGNTLNVLRAFAKQQIDAELVASPERLRNFSHLVLPGVGAFGYGMRSLRRLNLDHAIRALVADGRPVLGICLGMQLFADAGSENGSHRGLGLISGRIVHLGDVAAPEGGDRIPHTGWSDVLWGDRAEGNPVDRLHCAYFNHSFCLVDSEESEVVATAMVGGASIPAVISKGPILATQFHPEKSGEPGLRFLSTWFRAP